MKAPFRLHITLPLLFVVSFPIPSPAQGQDAVMQAMREELERSMEQLQLEGMNKPYFISYAVEDLRDLQVSASFGSIVGVDENAQRSLHVEVRVGSYDLDSSNFVASDEPPIFLGRAFGRLRLPIEDNSREIRRQLWLATDRAYKKAVEHFEKKRAVLENRTRNEELQDFSKEQPTTVTDAATPPPLERNQIEALVRELSSRFREMPPIHTSEVQFTASVSHTRYLNSEGSSFDRLTSFVTLVAKAATQADDGLPLEDFVALHGRTLSDLPPKSEMAASIDRMGAGVAALRQAPLFDAYNGPVLFEGQAAAELLAQVLAPSLLAGRRPVQEEERMSMFAGGGSLEDKIGALVLPKFLGLIDDPTQTAFKGAVLLGGYKVDDEAVAARATQVIEHGALKTLLADRTPVSGIPHSTGNRRGTSIMPSNIIVTTDNPMPREKLVQELLRLAQERGNDYGVLVRRMGNALYKSSEEGWRSVFPDEGSPVEDLIAVYKVHPDGREEMIRNARISGINPASFKEIVATSAADNVYSAPLSGGRFGFAPPSLMRRSVVSWVVPSLLFEDLTLKKPSGENLRPPISAHPYFDRKGGQ